MHCQSVYGNTMDSYHPSVFSEISTLVLQLFYLQIIRSSPCCNTVINTHHFTCNLSEISIDVVLHPVDNNLSENRYIQESKDMTFRSPLAIVTFWTANDFLFDIWQCHSMS
jgi:hypothetical protein